MSFKIIVLHSISLALAAVFGFFFTDFVFKINYWSLLGAGVAGIIYLSFLLIKTTLLEKSWADLASITLDIIIVSAFFWGNYNIWLWLAALITILGLWSTVAIVQSILNNSVKLRLRELGRHFFRPAFLALSFFVVAVYLSFINPELLVIPIEPIRYLVDLTAQTAPVKLPLPPEALADFIYRQLNQTLAHLPFQAKVSFLVLAGLIVLSIISSFSFIVAWIGSLISWLIFRLLLKTKFVKISTKQVMKEELIM